MTLKTTKYLGLCATILALGAIGCSEGSEDGDETGGASTGGTDTGGNGGATTGGTSTGGAANGGAETGGTSTGGAGVEEMLYTFDTGLEAFSLQDYATTAPYVNLATTSTLIQVTDAGSDGEPGMLEMTIPFAGYNELADIQKNLAAPEDWTDRILHAWVRIESGFAPDPSAPGGAYIFVKTGAAFVYGRGVWVNIPPESFGSWVELTFELSFPDYEDPGYDPAQVVSVGVQVATGAGAATSAAPTEALVHVDSFSIE